MLPMPERSPEELNEALRRRLEALVGDLSVIDGMTKRGAALPTGYVMSSISRYATRVLEALENREAVRNPWDGDNAF